MEFVVLISFLLTFWLWFKLSRVESDGNERAEIFSRRLWEMQRQLDDFGKVAAPAPTATATATPAPVPTAVLITAPPPLVQEIVEEVFAPPVPPAPRPIPTPQPPLPETRPSASQRLEEMAASTGGWEQLIGGNLLNKLGALVLVIGIALFLTYSFSSMGPAGRAFTGLGISLAMLATGIAVETRERYRVFARGLIAAGWAALYFTVYAIYAVPAAQVIESEVVGTELMAAVVLGMVLHSLKYRVQSLTGLAYGCIFAALALSTLNTFTAIALVPLAASALYLARRFEWDGLALLGAGATYAVFLMRPASGAPLFNIEAMLVLYWVMFEAFDILRLYSGKGGGPWALGLFALNAVAGLGASAAVWYRMAPESMWVFCTGAAALYIASTWVRFALAGETLYEFSLTISAVLTALAIVAKADGLWRSFGIILEAEILFLIGHYLRARFAKVLSLVVFVGAGRIAIDSGFETRIVLLTGGAVCTWTPSIALIAALFYFNWFLSREEKHFGYLATALVTLVIGVESQLRFVCFAWMVYAIVLMATGVWKKLPDLRYQSYALGLLSIAGATARFANDTTVPFAWTDGVGALVFLAAAVWGTRAPSKFSAGEGRVLRLGGSVGASFLGGLFVAHVVPAPYKGLGLMILSAALGEFAVRRVPVEMARTAAVLNASALIRIFWDHQDAIQKFPPTATWVTVGGAAVVYYWLTARLLRTADPVVRVFTATAGSLLALAALWMVLPAMWVPVSFAALAILLAEAGLASGAADLVSQGRAVSLIAAASLPFNAGDTTATRVFSSAGVAAAHALLRFRLRHQWAAFAHGSLAALIVAALLFNEVSGGMLTLSWSLEAIGLLVAGFVTRDRTLRLAGLGGLLLCIVKVFAYDLSTLETFYRILSFIGLGVILMAVSLIYTRFKEQLQKYL